VVRGAAQLNYPGLCRLMCSPPTRLGVLAPTKVEGRDAQPQLGAVVLVVFLSEPVNDRNMNAAATARSAVATRTATIPTLRRADVDGELQPGALNGYLRARRPGSVAVSDGSLRFC
jgi:hypothetical protein